MKSFTNVMATVFVLALLTGMGYLIILGVKYLIAHYNIFERDSAGIVIFISGILLLCTLIISGAIKSRSSKGDISVHPEKAYIYSDFINYYLTIRDSIQKDGTINYRFRSDMVLWAGKNVLKSYTLLNQFMDELNPDSSKILDQAEKVIIEMRRDMGQDNFGIKTGDLDKLMFVGEENDNDPTLTKNIKTS